MCTRSIFHVTHAEKVGGGWQWQRFGSCGHFHQLDCTILTAVKTLEFTLNGRGCRVAARSGESLLDLLRERCGITSIKNGCAPQGQCGACLAIIDGRAKVTCAMPAEAAEGREVVTLEGLPSDYRDQCASAFVAGKVMILPRLCRYELVEAH